MTEKPKAPEWVSDHLETLRDLGEMETETKAPTAASEGLKHWAKAAKTWTE